MSYVANTQYKFLVFLLLIHTIRIVLTWPSSTMTLLLIDLSIGLLVLLFCFINYSLKIEQAYVQYSIKLFKFSLFYKAIKPNQIESVIFNRVGVFRKLALIKRKKGFSIRVAFFKPNSVYEDIERFCIEHSIPYVKEEFFSS